MTSKTAERGDGLPPITDGAASVAQQECVVVSAPCGYWARTIGERWADRKASCRWVWRQMRVASRTAARHQTFVNAKQRNVRQCNKLFARFARAERTTKRLICRARATGRPGWHHSRLARSLQYPEAVLHRPSPVPSSIPPRIANHLSPARYVRRCRSPCESFAISRAMMPSWRISFWELRAACDVRRGRGRVFTMDHN